MSPMLLTNFYSKLWVEQQRFRNLCKRKSLWNSYFKNDGLNSILLNIAVIVINYLVERKKE